MAIQVNGFDWVVLNNIPPKESGLTDEQRVEQTVVAFVKGFWINEKPWFIFVHSNKEEIYVRLERSGSDEGFYKVFRDTEFNEENVEMLLQDFIKSYTTKTNIMTEDDCDCAACQLRRALGGKLGDKCEIDVVHVNFEDIRGFEA